MPRSARRSATWISTRRSPRTSQRRSPPNGIAATIARSRCVRSAATSRSPSAGDKIVTNVRGTRTSGANRDLRVPPSRRVDRPRGTGFRLTPRRHAQLRRHRTDTDDSRRAIMRADRPDSRSLNRTTVRSPRCCTRNPNTSADVTSRGSSPTTARNVFRSNASARSVFGRARSAANSRYRSTSGSPADTAPRPTQLSSAPMKGNQS
jgi:hypothetical protein